MCHRALILGYLLTQEYDVQGDQTVALLIKEKGILMGDLNINTSQKL